jgi:hypothetical protein
VSRQADVIGRAVAMQATLLAMSSRIAELGPAEGRRRCRMWEGSAHTGKGASALMHSIGKPLPPDVHREKRGRISKGDVVLFLPLGRQRIKTGSGYEPQRTLNTICDRSLQ